MAVLCGIVLLGISSITDKFVNRCASFDDSTVHCYIWIILDSENILLFKLSKKEKHGRLDFCCWINKRYHKTSHDKMFGKE